MDRRLKIDKRLPYIKVPKEKTDLFVNWYNEDLRKLEEIPEVFKEGYIEIDASDIVNVKAPSIFEINSEARYKNVIRLKEEFAKHYNKLTTKFLIKSDREMDLVCYFGTGDIGFTRTVLFNSDDKVTSVMNLLLKFNPEANTTELSERMKNLLPRIENTVTYDIMKILNMQGIGMEDIENIQKEFNKDLANVVVGIIVAVVWYLATNKSEKYIVNTSYTQDTSTTVHTNSKQSHNQDRYIKNPIYNLIDKKPITVERLIKKRQGWTISHSFQVRGHYRHYKNGKTVFIKSYEKGKGLSELENKVIVVSPSN